MLSVARSLIVLGLVLSLSGCVCALQCYNKPGSEKLHVVAARRAQYAIRINDRPEVAVPVDGRVVVDMPVLPRGCSVYVFGIIKVTDGRPERVRAVHILRDGKVVRRLSLRAIHDLPLDPDGYRIVKL